MLFSKQITVSADTSETNAIPTYIKIQTGVVSKVWITFPAGCAGLVKMRVLHGGHPFIPVNADNYLRGDNFTFELPVMYEITDHPTILSVLVWNEDATYSHTVDILILVLPKALVLPTGATEGILESLKTLVLHPMIIKEVYPEAV